MYAAPLALAALLSVDPAPPTPPADAGPAALGTAAPDRTWGEPPPGSTPEDADLWRRLHQATNDAVMAMSRLGQCAYRLRYGGYVAGLETAEGASGERAAKAAELRARLSKAAREADESIPKQGLRIRLCKTRLLHLEQRMDALDDPKMAAGMPEVRREAQRCVEETGAFARRLEPRADALEAALAEVDAFLGRAAPGPGPASAPAAPGGEAR